MTWQILLVINLLSASIREFLYKKLSDKITPLAMLFYVLIFSGVGLYFLQFVFYRQLPKFDITLSLTGIIIIVAFYSYFSAIKISLSQSILYQSYSILVTIVLAAIFLGEAKYFDLTTGTGMKVVAGIILAFISLWYMLQAKNKNEEKKEKKWFVYILITIFAMGVGSFATISYLHKFTSLEVLINQTNVMVVVVYLLMRWQKEKILIGRKLTQLTLVTAVFSLISVVMFYQALKIVPVAKFYPLQQVSLVIMTIFIGVVFYKEKSILTGKHLLGMILGLGGILLLVTS